MPSTLVPFITISAPNSFARSAAAESVVKNGLPVPPETITILLFQDVLWLSSYIGFGNL